MNWKEFEETIRKLVPEELTLEGDFYGWLTDLRPVDVKNVAVVVDLHKETDFSSYDVVISHHRPCFCPDFPVFVIHSALDRVHWGCHYSLAETLELTQITFLGNDRQGVLGNQHGSPESFLIKTVRLLNVKLVRFYLPERAEKVAVFSGCGLSYRPFLEKAIESGAQLVVSGDLTHSWSYRLKSMGIGFIDAGHVKTEIPGLRTFVSRLKECLELNVELVEGDEFYSYLCIG